MEVIGLCRFSYPAIGGFQVEHGTTSERVSYLYTQERMMERLKLFETIALPSLKAQKDPNFKLCILIGDSMPKKYKRRLEGLISEVPQVSLYTEPPRNHREVCKEILNLARYDPSDCCVQFRFDDDDAVSVNFVRDIRQAVSDNSGLIEENKTVAFDWNRGFLADVTQNEVMICRTQMNLCTAALAMYVAGNCKLTIMNFAHHKLGRFMPVVSYQEAERFVRTHNRFNDSRQKQVEPVVFHEATSEEVDILKNQFSIDIGHVRSVFSKAQ